MRSKRARIPSTALIPHAWPALHASTPALVAITSHRRHLAAPSSRLSRTAIATRAATTPALTFTTCLRPKKWWPQRCAQFTMSASRSSSWMTCGTGLRTEPSASARPSSSPNITEALTPTPVPVEAARLKPARLNPACRLVLSRRGSVFPIGGFATLQPANNADRYRQQDDFYPDLVDVSHNHIVDELPARGDADNAGGNRAEYEGVGQFPHTRRTKKALPKLALGAAPLHLYQNQRIQHLPHDIPRQGRNNNARNET